MPDLQVLASVTNTVDMQKIQKLMKKVNVSVLVGFLSGRTHVEAVHEPVNDKNGNPVRDKNGDPKYKGGSKVEQKNGQNITTAELAEELYYGTSTTPARPFLTDGLQSKEKELKEAIQKEVKNELDGKTANWDKIGTMAVGAIQEFVRGDYYKTHIPNGKEWQKIKHGDTPLIDGGDLINSMQYVIQGENKNK